MQLAIDIPDTAAKIRILEPVFQKDDSYTLKQIYEMDIDPEKLEAHGRRREAATPNVQIILGIPGYIHGNAEDKVDLVFYGEGYTESELKKSIERMNKVIEILFEVEPFKEYRSYFNLYQVIKPSKEAGLSVKGEPPIDTAYGFSNDVQKQKTEANTVAIFDVIYNPGNKLPGGVPLLHADGHIFLYQGEHGWLNAYATSSFAIMYDHSTDNRYTHPIAHELGHLFGKLGDEYYYNHSSRCKESQLNSGYGNAPINVSPKVKLEEVKWAHWVGSTFFNGKINTTIGMYEGAMYCKNGLYRPSEHSMMRLHSSYIRFDPIATEQIIKRIYRLVPHFLKVVPTEEKSIDCSSSCEVEFSVEVQKPATHELEVTWKFRGKSAAGKSVKIDFKDLSPDKTYILSVTSIDNTPAVRCDPTSLLTDRKSWSATKSRDGKVTIKYGSHFAYDFHKEGKTYSDAEADCEKRGGTLASIHSEEEAEMVHSDGNTWIGLNDKENEGEFEWVDGSAVEWTNWAPGQADNSGSDGENCAHIGGDSKQWNRGPCDQRMNYVCKHKVCLEGWVPFRRACYKANSPKTSWHGAVDACAAEGGRLPSVHNEAENRFLASLNVDGTWLGMNDINVSRLLGWTDGSEVYYTNWSNDQPKQGDRPICVRLNGNVGDWSGTICTDEIHYACRIDENDESGAEKSSNTACPYGWVSHLSNCYKPYINHWASTRLNWTEAEKACVAEGGHLPSIHSLAEHRFLISISGGDSWIGLTDAEKEGEWVWTDGTALDWTNWAPGQPDNYIPGGGEDCAYTTGPTHWNDFQCSKTLPYVCQKER